MSDSFFQYLDELEKISGIQSHIIKSLIGIDIFDPAVCNFKEYAFQHFSDIFAVVLSFICRSGDFLGILLYSIIIPVLKADYKLVWTYLLIGKPFKAQCQLAWFCIHIKIRVHYIGMDIYITNSYNDIAFSAQISHGSYLVYPYWDKRTLVCKVHSCRFWIEICVVRCDQRRCVKIYGMRYKYIKIILCLFAQMQFCTHSLTKIINCSKTLHKGIMSYIILSCVLIHDIHILRW